MAKTFTQPDWTRWYSAARWQRRRALQLRAEPLCRMCLAKNIVMPATVADHVESHRGDLNKFLLGELQSLCDNCHKTTSSAATARPSMTMDGRSIRTTRSTAGTLREVGGARLPF
jgi:hypothetical protein